MSETTPLLMKMLDPAWRDDCDYDEGAIKYHSGKHYKALQPSGPHRGGYGNPMKILHIGKKLFSLRHLLPVKLI